MLRSFYVALGAFVFAGTAALAQTQPSVVRTATAEVKEVQFHHRVTGSVRAIARGDVAALEEGRVTEVTVREGAVVHRGDVIARVDSRRLEAQQAELLATLRTVEAQIAQRTAELRQAKLDLARHKKLVDSRSVTVEEYEHRETSVTVAEAQLLAEQRRVAEIESQLQLLAVRLDDVVVRAYDGRVVERHAEPGEWIRAGEPFVTLVSTGQVEAWLDVPERYLQELLAGGDRLKVDASAISVEIRGSDRSYRAKSAKRVPDVHSRTRTFALVLTLDDAHGALTPGMSVDAWVPIGPTEPRLTVPKDAVIRDGRTAYVYKTVQQQGRTTAQQTAVTILFETGDVVVVRADALQGGDPVIVEGNERLLPGDRVTIAKQEPESSRLAREAGALEPIAATRETAP